MITLTQLAQVVDQKVIRVPKTEATNDRVTDIISIVLMIGAAVAVLVIVIAGLSYVLSNGDPQRTAKAKDTILYAVIGLVVAVTAQLIVSFVLKEIF